jgi:asparagine synthase (glutamine-hydrolysing)
VSVQFGRWNFDRQPVDPEYIDKVNDLLRPYATDGCSSYSVPGVTILCHAFHTTKESRREKQPHISNSGAVLTWDGRLDNRSELIRDLADVLTANSTDMEIVAAAYEEWGEASFARLIGDWALAIWNPATRSLILAKDPVGTRHLYYAIEERRITWSTILDPLVLLAGHAFQLCEEYIAGWLGFFPATHLTPYVGIDSVPSSSFVKLQPGKREIRKYWDFDPHKRIRYRTDAEYEEHFRIAFGEAVRRRLRSDSPVLAELSGGMDSSSIVCMADEIIARGMGETPRLDTISYYDDSEPNWNERPFFSKVEEKRGRAGCHIDVSAQGPIRFAFGSERFVTTPASCGGRSPEARRHLAECVASQRNRSLLSGVGGDEVTGGIPTPAPELMDLMTKVRLGVFMRQLTAWALSTRKPWLHLFFEASRDFLPPGLRRIPEHLRPAEWLDPDFTHRQWRALTGYASRVKLFGAPPSFQENASTLDLLRRQLACSMQTEAFVHEKRYPYLDRDLLIFLYAVPRQQLVRPGYRRSLMRRALSGIVPIEVLERRRKAYVMRSPLSALSAESASLVEMSPEMISVSIGVVDPNTFARRIQAARRNEALEIVPMMRTLALEHWLRAIRACKVWQTNTSIADAGDQASARFGFSQLAVERKTGK